jgi:hypothetical protein
MADRATQLLLDGLVRAAADPTGSPLFDGKAGSGLFTANNAGKSVAQRCKDEGFLRIVRTENKGKTAVEFCALTDKGLSYLLSQANPRQLIEDLLRALETRHAQAEEMVAAARRMQSSLDGLRAVAETVLRQLLQAPASADRSDESEPWLAGVVPYLEQRHEAGAPEDCALPELFYHARQFAPTLTIGQFHDALRRLLESGRIYLHPWTGPLYDLPEPPLALLVGHEIAYYASKRAA